MILLHYRYRKMLKFSFMQENDRKSSDVRQSQKRLYNHQCPFVCSSIHLSVCPSVTKTPQTAYNQSFHLTTTFTTTCTITQHHSHHHTYHTITHTTTQHYKQHQTHQHPHHPTQCTTLHTQSYTSCIQHHT